MTPIRALFFLAAITAACAGRIPAKVQDTNSLETQIALLASHRLVGNPIDSGIDKFKELVEKIKERVEALESELIDALEGSSLAVVKKINDFITKRTGVDLKLDEKWENLEKKTETCTSEFKVSLKDIVLEIKKETQTCAATQINDAKEAGVKILALVDILEVVPAKTIKAIKACGAAPTTPAPPTEAPTDAPDTEAPATDAPAPEDSDSDAPVALRDSHSVGSWSDAWRKAKCVAGALSAAAKELVEVPDLVEKIYDDIKDLSSGDSRKALEKCAEEGIVAKAPRVQEAVAVLAYCVIAPSKQ